MKYLFSVILTCISIAGIAQIKDPVQWSYSARKKSNNIYELVVTASVPSPWHIYSQNTPKGGPIPTKITYKSNPLISVDGNLKENGKLQKIHDENFGVDVLYYSTKVEFVQTLKLKSAVKTNISGTVEYMVCDDHQCLPPTKKTFDVKLDQ
jgi:hypothetical protein